MWIRRITLENIRCFDNIELNFEVGTQPHKFTLFIGENGTGKSTILKAIAMAISGPRSMPLLVPDGRLWVREGKDTGFIEVNIQNSPDDFGPDLSGSLKLTFNKSDREVKWEPLHSYPDQGWFVAAYGPFRIPPSLTERKEFYESWDDPRTLRVINLFQPRSKLVSLDSWLKQLDYERLRQNKLTFNIFIDAINKLFPSNFPVRFFEINPEGLAIFTTPHGKTNLDGLSDGYRSMMIWVSDLLKNLMSAFPNSTDPLYSSGILLLDELDVHLHPRWQREIVTPLMKFFPNLQIITTTHSPLVLQGAKEGKIILCKSEGNRVILDDELPSVEGWRADQILEEKDFFGVDVYDHETEEQLDRYRRLMAKSERSSNDEHQLTNLIKELKSKRVVEVASSDSDYQQYQRLATQLEALKKEKEKDSERMRSASR